MAVDRNFWHNNFDATPNPVMQIIHPAQHARRAAVI
jgi:hypothetical protein